MGQRPMEIAVVSGLAEGLNEVIKKGRELWKLHGTSTLAIGENEIVKIGTSLDPDGTTNLEYVNTQLPSIPTPSLLGCLRSGRRTYVFMSRAEGVTLESISPELSRTQKLSIQTQLNAMFQALRVRPTWLDFWPCTMLGDVLSSLQRLVWQQSQHVGPTIGSFVSMKCKDTRRLQRVSDVPIHSEAEFNDFLLMLRPRKNGKSTH